MTKFSDFPSGSKALVVGASENVASVVQEATSAGVSVHVSSNVENGTLLYIIQEDFLAKCPKLLS